MSKLEKQVRQALIEQKTDELIRCVSENPEYKSLVNELAETMIETILASTISEEMDEEEKEEAKQELRKEVLPNLKSQYDNPEQLRQLMYEQAKKEYTSLRQFKAVLKAHFSEIRQDEELRGVAAEYEKAYKGLLKYYRIKDKIIRRLAKIAEKEGVDKAVQKDTKYAVIREFFPTPDKLRNFVLGNSQAVSNFYSQAKSALMADGESGQAAGEMVGCEEKAMKKAQEIVERMQGDSTEKMIKEIYG